MRMAWVYIVEDDRNIREIERFALQNSGYQVEEFSCAKDFYNGISQRTPDCVLLDILLPDEDGLEILTKFRSVPGMKRIPVMMVTAKTAELDKVRGLDMGADDYITKPFGIMELISRVKALLRRSMGAAEEGCLSAGEISLDGVRRQVYVQGNPCDLTYKEYELLKLLLQNRGIVLSRDVIMERIWDMSFEGESRTLDVHVKTLRRKLGGAGAQIRTVRNVGYMID